MDVTQRTIDDLAFRELLLALSRLTRTEAGRERALARPFLNSEVEVADALTRVDEARLLGEQGFALPLGGVTDVRTALDRAQKSGVLEPRDLIACAQTLFAFLRTREAVEERESRVPGLAILARRLPLLEPLALRVDHCFEPDGEIADRASSELKEARDRVRGLHRHIKGRLDVLLHDEKFLRNLRETYYTLRNGRYVVPVLAQQQGEVPGIVHNASQTGQTLFVEPQALQGLGNELAIAQSVVAEEERRVLTDLTNALAREAPAILEGVAACAELDELEAAARLSVALDAHPPVLEPHTGHLELRNLRHPLLLLAGKEVVGNDVLMSPKERALVISGPNAGGKTVTLKAVGLCALMLRAGLPIPAAAKSRLPLYDSVHSAVGDAQDLSLGLSTFSAHVMELRDIVNGARDGSLILIDEIAADTDPKEGAAIAIAVLESLIERGARVLVTTHLEEVKALTHLDPRFLNARVGFDARKMAPTFRLQLGASGASSAIDVASRMGLPPDIVERARTLVRSAGGPMAQALAAAEEDRRRASDALAEAQKTLKEAHARSEALEQERKAFEKERCEQQVERAEAVQAQTEAASRELNAMLAALRNDASLRATEQARDELSARRDEADQATRKAQSELMRFKAPDAPAELSPGLQAHHLRLGRDVEILEVMGDEVLVAVGSLKMRVPSSELTAPVHAAKRSGRTRFPMRDKQAQALKKAEASAPATLTAANLRCDVRGMRVDEALREVEGFLDRAFRSGDAAALILHGHGTGALRQTIRDALDHSPYVRLFRPGEPHEGGDGVTVVALQS